MKNLLLEVKVSHPWTNTPQAGVTDESGQRTEIRVTDERSHMLVLRLSLTPEEFGQLLSGRLVHLRGEATELPERLGLTRKATTVHLGRTYTDAEVEKLTGELKLAGWQSIDLRKTNTGDELVAVRWVDE